LPTLFAALFPQSGIRDHVAATVEARLRLDDAKRIQIDTCIIFWFYTTVSADMLDVLLWLDDTALGVRSAIRTIFLSNGNESGLAVTLLAVAIRSLTLSLSRKRFCFV
jgi:hypothetical protein